MRPGEFAELRAFAAVVRHGSFTNAAAKLGVSPPALSQTIRNLEERLGVRLLNRTTRSVAATPAGAKLAAELLPVLDSLDGIVEAALEEDSTPTGLLRISAARVAIPLLEKIVPGFLATFPRVRLEIDTDDRMVDIVREGFDAGIRLGERVERDMVAIRFGDDLRMAVVGAPGYFASHPIPTHPRQLADHNCLVMRSPTDASVYKWEFEKSGEELRVAVDGALTCNDPSVRIAAACAGFGLAYLFEHQVTAHIAAGSLQRVLADWTPPYPGCFLYYPGRRNQRPALRAFIDYARSALAKAEA